MIAKRVQRDSATSSFAKLAQYIADLSKTWTPNKNDDLTVGDVRITNCMTDDNIELASLEILATQGKNKTSQADKTYHMIVSFPASERPSNEVLKSIEDYLVNSIGLGKHQRISAIHTDTDNLHIHVAINKVSPDGKRNVEPYFDHPALMRACTELEALYGLKATNHGKTLKQKVDFEAHSLEQSFIQTVRNTAIEPIKTAQSWDELHQKLGAIGLTIKARGAGLIIATQDGQRFAKISSIEKSLNLVGRLGQFKQAPQDTAQASFVARPAQRRDSVLFDQFIQEQSKQRAARLAAQSESAAARANATAKMKATHAAKLKRAKEVRAGRDVYAALARERKRDFEAARSKRERLPAPINFERWLIAQATQGNVQALSVLRRRIDASSQQARITSTRIRGNAPMPANAVVTRNGSYGQKVRDGGAISTSHIGTRVDTATESAILLAARIELEYGGPLRLTGSSEFKSACVSVLRKHGLEQHIGDALPAERVQVSSTVAQGLKTSAVPVSTAQQPQKKDITSDRGNEPGIRINRVTTDGLRVAHTSAIAERPASQRLDSVRTLSLGDVVRDKEITNVLLPIHPLGSVEHGQTNGVEPLRRPSGGDAGAGGSGGEKGAGSGGITADEYIAERNKLRAQISDIPYHRVWDKKDAGASKYMGKRQFKGGVTALLIQRSSGEMLILSTKQNTTYSVGQTIQVSATGDIKKSRGR